MTDNIEFISTGLNHEMINVYEFGKLKATFLKSYETLVCCGSAFPDEPVHYGSLGRAPYWLRATDYHQGTTPTTEKNINSFLYNNKPHEFECLNTSVEDIKNYFLYEIRNGGGSYT
tara:strand:- start:11 stop:358 length:348 start_codon:yes stop_codon:yes gene_type:complete